MIYCPICTGTGFYNYRMELLLQDDFANGTTSSGNIGQTGWAGAGTITQRNSEAGAYGVIRFDTGGSQGTNARIQTNVTIQFDFSLPTILEWRVRLNQKDSNTTFYLGAMNAVNASPAQYGLYFQTLDADSNMFCVVRNNNVQTGTLIDTGLAASTSFANYKITTLPGIGAMFYINDVLVAGPILTNFPSTFLNPGGYIINSAAASKHFDVDHVKFYQAVSR